MIVFLIATALAVPFVTRGVEHEGTMYQVVTVDLREAKLDLVGQRDGAPHTFAELGETPVATNAGIFHSVDEPVGLWIEGGQAYHPIERADGDGNFFMKPNGVFWVDGYGAHVTGTAEFSPTESMRIATQSGPTLALGGQIHPTFNAGSTPKRVRSGIGVSGPWTVHIALSNEPVGLYDFATLFTEKLDSGDALYLDGTISGLIGPSIHEVPPTGQFAGFLVASIRVPRVGVQEGDVVFHRSTSVEMWSDGPPHRTRGCGR